MLWQALDVDLALTRKMACKVYQRRVIKDQSAIMRVCNDLYSIQSKADEDLNQQMDAKQSKRDHIEGLFKKLEQHKTVVSEDQCEKADSLDKSVFMQLLNQGQYDRLFGSYGALIHHDLLAAFITNKHTGNINKQMLINKLLLNLSVIPFDSFLWLMRFDNKLASRIILPIEPPLPQPGELTPDIISFLSMLAQEAGSQVLDDYLVRIKSLQI